MRRHLLYVFVLVLATTIPGFAGIITNGDFSSGLNGWTMYNTASGSATMVTSNFNVTGGGTSDALTLQVGAANPWTTGEQGGGAFQQFTLASAETFDFSADIAASVDDPRPDVTGNADGGTLSLLVDGFVVDSYSFNFIDNHTTERSALGGSLALTPGSHTLYLQATRGRLLPATGLFDYFDNVTVSAVTAVPEPASLLLLGTGFITASRAVRRKLNG